MQVNIVQSKTYKDKIMNYVINFSIKSYGKKGMKESNGIDAKPKKNLKIVGYEY